MRHSQARKKVALDPNSMLMSFSSLQSQVFLIRCVVVGLGSLGGSSWSCGRLDNGGMDDCFWKWKAWHLKLITSWKQCYEKGASISGILCSPVRCSLNLHIYWFSHITVTYIWSLDASLCLIEALLHTPKPYGLLVTKIVVKLCVNWASLKPLLLSQAYF